MRGERKEPRALLTQEKSGEVHFVVEDLGRGGNREGETGTVGGRAGAGRCRGDGREVAAT